VQVHPICAMLPPTEMRANAFLSDGARQLLDSRSRMLLLAGVDDRLWSQFL
jgi:hypothetical protein